jgi:exonuclease VII small subunit
LKERILKINTERGFVFETVVARREELTHHINSGVHQLENLMTRQDQVDAQTLLANAELETQLHRLEETIRPLEKIKR